MYTRSMRNVIECVSNNQEAPIQLFFAKTLHGIDLFSFNKTLHCMEIPLIVWLTGMEICLM